MQNTDKPSLLFSSKILPEANMHVDDDDDDDDADADDRNDINGERKRR
jgi:hypothetical protein